MSSTPPKTGKQKCIAIRVVCAIEALETIKDRCQASSYAGTKRLLANDTAGAADLFRKCLATRQCDRSEYELAAAELKTLDNPPPAKTP